MILTLDSCTKVEDLANQEPIQQHKKGKGIRVEDLINKFKNEAKFDTMSKKYVQKREKFRKMSSMYQEKAAAQIENEKEHIQNQAQPYQENNEIESNEQNEPSLRITQGQCQGGSVDEQSDFLKSNDNNPLTETKVIQIKSNLDSSVGDIINLDPQSIYQLTTVVHNVD